MSIPSKTNDINRKNSFEESQKTFISNTKLEQKPSIKKVQLTIKINITFKLIDVVPTFPFSQTITFRLNPRRSSPSRNEIENKNLTSKIYFNPKLAEKINQFKPKLHVDLSYCFLTDSDLSIITNQLIIEKKCTELWLYGNNITSKGITILASSLINNSTLKSLDLSFNQISNLGVRLLSEVLIPNQYCSLKILYLSKNMISDDGIKYLSSMLEINQTLTDLWLSNNEISNEGIKQLANALIYHNKTLKFLSISMNLFITDLCIDYLIEIFEHNQTLKILWITDCNLTEQGKIKLQQIADQKKKLKIHL